MSLGRRQVVNRTPDTVLKNSHMQENARMLDVDLWTKLAFIGRAGG